MYVRQYVGDARAREKPCLQCGLSLRPHLDERFCPQCGLSVWLSLNGNDSLDYSNAIWLRKAAQGAWILASAQLLALAAYALSMVGYALSEVDAGALAALRAATTQVAVDGERVIPELPPSVPVALAALVLAAYFVVNAVGLWWLSIHEQRYPDRSKTARVVARVAAGVSVLVAAGLVALALPRVRTGWPIEALWSWPVLFTCEVTFGAGALAAWLILRRVAQRAGKSGLSKLCGYLLFLPALTLLKAAPFIGLWFLFLLRPLFDLLPIVYIPLSMYLFVRFALLLRGAAPQAEAAWAAESNPARPTQAAAEAIR